MTTTHTPTAPETIPEIWSIRDICSKAIEAGLRDLSLDFEFLLSVLPPSGGMHAEKINN